MHSAQPYIQDAIANTQQALEKIPHYLSILPRSAIERNLSALESKEDVDSYVRSLLTDKEQDVCDHATD